MQLYRARCFADFMETREFSEGSRLPDCPFSLYEGLAGTACFFADMANPDKAALPTINLESRPSWVCLVLRPFSVIQCNNYLTA